MHEDLLRRALESKKTTSRKQQSRSGSAANSLNSSRQGSRQASRVGSAANSTTASAAGSDDDDWSDDTMSIGLSSIDRMLQDADWENKLHEAVSGILGKDRESKLRDSLKDLQLYLYALRIHVCDAHIEGQAGDLCRAFLKVARSGSETEAIVALRCIAATALTDATEDHVDICAKSLQHLAETADAPAVKTQAVHAYGAVHFFGHLGEDELSEPLEWLLEIVATDGQELDALDNGSVVAAALEQYGFLLTLIDDLKFFPRDGWQAVLDQLESADVAVQIAAGQVLALIYGQSYATMDDLDESEIPHDVKFLSGKKLPRFEPFDDKIAVLALIDGVLRVSAKRMTKKNKRSLHAAFQEIRTTVEDPALGPGYNPNQLDADAAPVGYRLTQRINQRSELRVEEWWVLLRLRELKRILGPGLRTHLDAQPALIAEVLDESYVQACGHYADVERRKYEEFKTAQRKKGDVWTDSPADLGAWREGRAR